MNKIPPLVVMLAVGVLMWLVSLSLPSITVSPIISISLAALIALAGAIFSVAGVWSFRKFNTTVNPLTPDQSSSLVDFGIYKISRNPMYVGFALFLISWGVLLANLFSLVSVLIFVWYMNKFQILPEEKALLKLFGKDYQCYKAQVSRWL